MRDSTSQPYVFTLREKQLQSHQGCILDDTTALRRTTERAGMAAWTVWLQRCCIRKKKMVGQRSPPGVQSAATLRVLRTAVNFPTEIPVCYERLLSEINDLDDRSEPLIRSRAAGSQVMQAK